jgi:hypothetical protein
VRCLHELRGPCTQCYASIGPHDSHACADMSRQTAVWLSRSRMAPAVAWGDAMSVSGSPTRNTGRRRSPCLALHSCEHPLRAASPRHRPTRRPPSRSQARRDPPSNGRHRGDRWPCGRTGHRSRPREPLVCGNVRCGEVPPFLRARQTRSWGSGTQSSAWHPSRNMHRRWCQSSQSIRDPDSSHGHRPGSRAHRQLWQGAPGRRPGRRRIEAKRAVLAHHIQLPTQLRARDLV